jgi:hypothetical protein
MTTTSKSEPKQQQPPEPSGLEAWKGRTWHKPVTLPSGVEVAVRIPSLAALIKEEGLPDRLRALVIKASAHPGGLQGVTREDYMQTEEKPAEERQDLLAAAVSDLADLQQRLVLENVRTLDGETLTAEDLDGVPEPDKEWLGLIMLRQIAYDAKGVRLGVEPLDSWERFRHWHGCGDEHGSAGCSACASLQDEFSTADLGHV